MQGVVPMIGYLPFLLWFALLLFSLLDIDRAPEGSVRGLPTGGWFLVVLLVPILGAVVWLVAGRPKRAPGSTGRDAAPRDGSLAAAGPADAPPLEWLPPADGQQDDRLRAILERIDREFDEAVRRSRERHLRPGS